WPREVYGCLLQELTAQGAKAVAFDIIFGGLRPDHPLVRTEDGHLLESDEFFALALRHASNAIISVTDDVQPPLLFATNALALGEISTEKDADGVLRRVRAFHEYIRWHPAFLQAAHEFNLDLSKAKVGTNQIVLYQSNGEPIPISLDTNGNFNLSDFGGTNLPPGMEPTGQPFTRERVWHMGIQLAAQELGLDLQHADVDWINGRITLHGANGVVRVIPMDQDGFFYVDWSLTPDDPRIAQESIGSLLRQNRLRRAGITNDLKNHWQGKLVVVGSAVQGNDLTDRGATTIRKDTLLVSKHWNVANSIITGRFIQRSSATTERWLIAVLAILSAVVTWRLRVLMASVLVVLFSMSYIAWCFSMFANERIWLPMVWPILGAMLMTHVCLVTWRVLFEQAEQRRVKGVFSKIVSPDIVHELLKTERLSLGGTRREITVYFADVRGFTNLTDESHALATEYVKDHKLSDAEAEAYLNEHAQETLRTVNGYLGLIADTIKKHGGTLDKYIGDCVMAFWGAPTANRKHAVSCVHAAIEAQRGMRELNLQRKEENRKLEVENQARVSAGLTPKPLLSLLMLGSGINTGLTTVGLMGSESHISNYTVFGREVNLASRLEGLSGRGRILIGEMTYVHLKRDDPVLAETCRELPSQDVRGFRTPVKVYEVPWLPKGARPMEEEFPSSASSGETIFIPRYPR
ncbi:MAG TPA: adenylate/guanylate cyclase domain-containing protein, partial [Verrucomicrobiae bacterium]|nr:adenylate/guanylate cyclase domain-containing protein [Verrucomicrobiae bacterium]